jgi:hypothetical protein
MIVTGEVPQLLREFVHVRGVRARRFALHRACDPGVTLRDNFKLKIKLSIGAGEGIRTLDPDLGKVVLYP